jgi:uncharacterized protein (TIGR03435 family)
MSSQLAGEGDMDITRAQNRNYCLAEGFLRQIRQSNGWTLFLRYQAQSERLYRRALDEFERLKALRPPAPLGTASVSEPGTVSVSERPGTVSVSERPQPEEFTSVSPISQTNPPSLAPEPQPSGSGPSVHQPRPHPPDLLPAPKRVTVVDTMHNLLRKFPACLTLTVFAAFAQAPPAFEVASIKPAALDMAKITAAVQAGSMPKMGAHVDGARAEYIFMSLRDLIVTAYKLKPFQVIGPDWLPVQRFDVFAKLPDGASKDDAPKMLQTLLAERFGLVVRHDTSERPVLALVLAKGGVKMKESTETPKPIDTTVPLKPGEMQVDSPDGPVRATVGKDGSSSVDMGAKGKMTYKMDPATQALHMEASMITMSGFADMLTQFSQMGGTGGRQVVDMTGLKGNYQVALDIPIADLINMARAAGMDVSGAPSGGPAGAVPTASDPTSSSTIFTTVQALGLKLESRKAPVEQLIVDHAEKNPTGN